MGTSCVVIAEDSRTCEDVMFLEEVMMHHGPTKCVPGASEGNIRKVCKCRQV